MNRIAKDILIASSLLLSVKAQSQIISTDTALLVELVTTTATQLNELEKLVSNAEKHTARIQKYNELVQDEYFRAERVLYLAESAAAKKEATKIEDLNWAIKELKYSLDEMKDLMKDYGFIKNEEKRTKGQVLIEKKLNTQKEKIALSQVKKASDAKTTGRATQLTAQNTALIFESNTHMHKTQLEILEKVSTTNRLLAEQLEDKRLEQMEKEKSYGLGEKR